MQVRCKILREKQKQKTQPINLYPPKLFLQMKAKQGLFQTKIESISGRTACQTMLKWVLWRGGKKIEFEKLKSTWRGVEYWGKNA